MNKKLILTIILISTFITACGKSYGAYWEFGNNSGNPLNQVYLESRYSCVVENEDNMFYAACTHKRTGDIEYMWVKYYKHGSDFVVYP